MQARFLPQSIASQIVLLVILSAIIFHLCISAAFFIGRGSFDNQNTPRERNRLNHINHVADYLKIADGQSKQIRAQMLSWLQESEPSLDIRMEPLSPPPTSTPQGNPRLLEAIESRVGPHIQVTLPPIDRPFQRMSFRFEDGLLLTMAIPYGPFSDSGPPPPDRAPRLPSGPDAFGGASDSPGPPPPPPSRLGPPDDGSHVISLVFGTLLFIAISFTLFLVWAVRSLTRPLRKFAEAVDQFAFDGPMTQLEETGPVELRAAAHALNRMQERVKVMIDQRTQMLAAISHDLRTPVTRLRLRAEFIEPSDIRDPVLRDIEQMDALVHSALSFIRDGVEVQRNALLDLGALLQTVCDEFADMGYKVNFEATVPISIKGNADELYRAVTNLVSNAVNVGTQVDVLLRRAGDDRVEIEVVDDGPGIASDQKTAMLAPFIRGDEARKHTGKQGFGLGLPIVLSIVTAHHGTLDLLDRAPHGLIARITLPV